MKFIKLLPVAILVFALSSCVSYRPAIITQNSPLVGYKYVYISPTNELKSNSSSIAGNIYGVYGSTKTKSINPSNAIAGVFLKNGYKQVTEIDPELAHETIIVNFAESGRRKFTWGYTLEVTIQLLSAKTQDIICTSTAEGCGSTEADDIRIAINRCMEKIFPPAK